MILLAQLGITQQELRNQSQLVEMVQYVKSGGLFTRDAIAAYHVEHEGSDGYVDLIEIARFEDGKMYLRNGHHRAVAIYLGGRQYISDEECRVSDFQYNDFTGINLSRGWVTPFDVRTHVRIADLAAFKREVRKFEESAEAVRFILANPKLYSEEKRFEGVAALANAVECQHAV